MSIITDYFNQPFYQQYQNPDAVIIALFLIVFLVIFSILTKIKVFERPITVIITTIISLFSLAYIPRLYDWTATLNIFLVLAVIGIAFFIAKPFLKFLRQNLGF